MRARDGTMLTEYCMRQQVARETRTLRAAYCLVLVLLLLLFLSTPSCTSRSNRIVVGSKNFTESMVLGEMFAQMIEARTHLEVERRFYLAGTFICHQAIVAGRIDVYPEYTGTALTAVLKEQPGQDKQAVYRRVMQKYENQFGLTLSPPLGFDDTFAIVIRGEDARRLKLRTLSQAATYTPQWRAGFGYEFMERPDGYKGLVAAYGLHFAEAPRIMDLGLITRALKEHQVDIVAGNNTDGLIPALDLFVLEDDRHYFPPYEGVAVMRVAMAREHPEVKAALDALAGAISDEDLRQVNYAVDGQRRDLSAVVRTFLQQRKLIN
ncbi:MAG TPA: glycine betaine ABC transporter substrate-binding protein [Terriglobales bacterium]|nr:glycine betaine ABC transporter substrate-binding protein [Terriglobales bacterium]